MAWHVSCYPIRRVDLQQVCDRSMIIIYFWDLMKIVFFYFLNLLQPPTQPHPYSTSILPPLNSTVSSLSSHPSSLHIPSFSYNFHPSSPPLTSTLPLLTPPLPSQFRGKDNAVYLKGMLRCSTKSKVYCMFTKQQNNTNFV